MRPARVGRGDDDRKEQVMKAFGWGKAIVMGVALTVLGAGPAPAAKSTSVEIKEFTFAPKVLTVARGTTVTWINHDEEPHTITSAKGAFGSTGLSNDEQFSQTFKQSGRYEYFCALHPHMKAVVIVK
jgi:plastocyanin